MAKSSVKFKWDEKKLGSINLHMLQGMYMMGSDIENKAKMNAPYLTGALSDSIRTLRIDNGNIIEVVAGGVGFGRNIPYALMREYGPNRNKSTEHYMKNAMDFVMQGDYLKHYFGDVIK